MRPITADSIKRDTAMNSREAIRHLRAIREKIDKENAIENTQLVGALDFAIETLKRAPDYRKIGSKGGSVTATKYGRKQMKEWGKLGGRPPKRKAGT